MPTMCEFELSKQQMLKLAEGFRTPKLQMLHGMIDTLTAGMADDSWQRHHVAIVKIILDERRSSE